MKQQSHNTLRHERLPCGVTFVTEHHPSLQTLSTGIWINAGAAQEKKTQNGFAHFLEHMCFKGTKKRNCQEISRDIENNGGYVNAYTSREHTAYYIHGLKEHMTSLLEILSDMVLNSSFPQLELEQERKVVLEEIRMYNDKPSAIALVNLDKAAYGDTPMGRSILGPARTIENCSQEDLRTFVQHFYGPSNIIVAMVGNLNHDKMAQVVNGLFQQAKQVSLVNAKTYPFKGKRLVATKKDIEQVHLALAVPALTVLDEGYYSALAMDYALGSGMASRLFQRVRVKEGLAYAVKSFLYNDTTFGMLGVYAGTSPDKALKCLNIIRETLRTFAASITLEEIKRGIAQIKRDIFSAFENPDSRARQIAVQTLHYGKPLTQEEMLLKLQAVTADSIQDVAERLLGKIATTAFSVVGPEDFMKKHDLSLTL